jgi:hypothetical protein
MGPTGRSVTARGGQEHDSGRSAGRRAFRRYGNEILVGGDRNWRNNNPGNLEAGEFAGGHGGLGTDGRFAIFPDRATGLSALVALLSVEPYISLTLEGAMIRYAPPSENDTESYLRFIEKLTNLVRSVSMGSLSEADRANSPRPSEATKAATRDRSTTAAPEIPPGPASISAATENRPARCRSLVKFRLPLAGRRSLLVGAPGERPGVRGVRSGSGFRALS